MIDFVEQHGLRLNQFDLIVPVPLSSTRQRERGYNQSQLLAEHIGLKHALKLSTHNLIRIRHTSFQARISVKERWTNIHGAFKINHPLKFKNKSVLVIDDLFTTGATVSEVARVLKESGAKEVGVLTLAIA